ncbi:MAG: phage regulatory CII family protein [Desulfovibrionaceae bacterium]
MGHLLEITHQAVIERRDISVSDLAQRLGKRPSSLYNEINPRSPGSAKLGAEDLLRIMDILHDTRPLEYMAAALGCAVTPLPGAQPGPGRDAEPPVPPSVEQLRAMILDVLCRLGALADGLRRASDRTGLSPRRCLDLMLGCQQLHLDLGRLAALAQRGAERDRT